MWSQSTSLSLHEAASSGLGKRKPRNAVLLSFYKPCPSDLALLGIRDMQSPSWPFNAPEGYITSPDADPAYSKGKRRGETADMLLILPLRSCTLVR